MLLSVILLVGACAAVGASDVTRDFFGDIFRMRDCHNGSRCDGGGRRAALQVPGRPCYCQCAPTHLAYREDKQQCVKDIKECYMSVFYRPFTVEAIPLVYLPTSGQLVHPDAHLSLSMRRNFESGLAKCRVTVSQYLTREGWRTLSKADGSGNSIFGLFTDANKTYLQFLGNGNDRKLLQQHLALIRLLCIIPQYPAFETCVAIRVGWVPGVENIDDVPAPASKANMLVVGLSLGVLALVYIFAVLVYLKIRRQMIAKQKGVIDQEAKLQSCDEDEDKATNLHRLESSSRLELYHTTSLGRQKPSNKSGGYRGDIDPWNQLSPIVETFNRTWTDRMGQHGSEFTAQDFKLEPEFFEPELMASPPHEVLEYLERLQNSITFARHRMRSCYRYQPTLNGIPEDDYYYQELERKDSQSKEVRTTPDGGSASSVGSLQESADGKNEAGELPKIPPRKPKRKTLRSERSKECLHGSDQEQKEIQKAMNALNDTLDALEYDIYKQEVLNQASDTETANMSCQNSTSIDFDDFETSSCSSMSAATILGRDGRRLSDISKCSQFLEKNQSEDVSTFYNSTYNLHEAMRGLFHDANKVRNTVESDMSNESSRCTSRNGFTTQTNIASKSGLVKINDDSTKELNTTDISSERINFNVKDHQDTRERYVSGNANNFCEDKNFSSPSGEHGLKKPKSPIPDYTLKKSRQKNIRLTGSSPIKDNTESNLNEPGEPRDDRNSMSVDSERGTPNADENMTAPRPPSRNIMFEEKKLRNIKTPELNIKEEVSSKVSQSRTPTPKNELRQANNASPNVLYGRTPTPNKGHRQAKNTIPNQLQARTPTPNKDDKQANNMTPNRLQRDRTVSSSASQDSDLKNASDSEGHPLRKCPSNESMTTTATDMTTDSLESRCATPSHPSPTPSLVELWITKLVSTSVPYSKSRRKSKKKLILPEQEIEGWRHVCQKHNKDPCPLHDLNDSEPNIIDKLAHYGSKTMAGCDVAGYFQSLKQDVLKEHLRAWISSNCQRHKKGASPDSESSHTKPLVKGQESNLVDENGMHLSHPPLETSEDVAPISMDQISPDDSLEPSSMEVLLADANQ